MGITKEQEELYRRTMEDVKKQLDHIDEDVEKELQKVRKRLAELQESKKSLRMVYEGVAKLLGIELAAETDDDQTDAMTKM